VHDIKVIFVDESDDLVNRASASRGLRDRDRLRPRVNPNAIYSRYRRVGRDLPITVDKLLLRSRNELHSSA